MVPYPKVGLVGSKKRNGFNRSAIDIPIYYDSIIAMIQGSTTDLVARPVN